MGNSNSGMGRKRKFTSEVELEKTSLLLEIKDFKEVLQADPKLQGVTLEFDAGETIGLPSRWKFFFSTDDEGEIHINLRLLESPDNRQVIIARFQYNLPGGEWDGNEAGFNFKGSNWGVPILPPTEDFLHPDSDLPNYLKNGHLSINLDFTLYGDIHNVLERESKPKLAKLMDDSRSEVAKDLGELLASGADADITIQTSDGQELKAHKTILSARSPVFFAMFETALTESASGVVIIEDISSEVMKTLLKFIYTGKPEANWEMVIGEVLYTAEKYSLTLLKEYCDRMLPSTCTPKNALNLLKAAELHELNQAQSEIFEYVVNNIRSILKANKIGAEGVNNNN